MVLFYWSVLSQLYSLLSNAFILKISFPLNRKRDFRLREAEQAARGGNKGRFAQYVHPVKTELLEKRHI